MADNKKSGSTYVKEILLMIGILLFFIILVAAIVDYLNSQYLNGLIADISNLSAPFALIITAVYVYFTYYYVNTNKEQLEGIKEQNRILERSISYQNQPFPTAVSISATILPPQYELKFALTDSEIELQNSITVDVDLQNLGNSIASKNIVIVIVDNREKITHYLGHKKVGALLHNRKRPTSVYANENVHTDFLGDYTKKFRLSIQVLCHNIIQTGFFTQTQYDIVFDEDQQIIANEWNDVIKDLHEAFPECEKKYNELFKKNSQTGSEYLEKLNQFITDRVTPQININPILNDTDIHYDVVDYDNMLGDLRLKIDESFKEFLVKSLGELPDFWVDYFEDPDRDENFWNNI